MPHANREERLAQMRERYRQRLETERGFRDKESLRKRIYYATNRRYRERTKAKALARYHGEAA